MVRILALSLSLAALFANSSLAESGPEGSLAADLNTDLTVNFDDFFLLVDQFGQSCSADCSALSADLNDDQAVNFDDFFLFVDQFGQTVTSVLVPPQDQVVPLGSTLTLALELSQVPPGDPLFFVGPLPLPQGARFDRATGIFAFTPVLEQAGQSFDLLFGASIAAQNDCHSVRLTVPALNPGTTVLSGRVLDTQSFVEDGLEVAIVGATVSLLNRGISTTTGADGRFVLRDIPADSLVLDIDASTADPGPDSTAYASFREQITVLAGVENIVARPFYLPRLEIEASNTVVPSRRIRVINRRLEVELEVQPNSARGLDGELYTGELSISEVPANLAPAALPSTADPALLITIQPVGVTFDPPAPITFPNLDNAPDGSQVDIWSLDPTTGAFAVVGVGQVFGDAIRTVSGGVRQADWHYTLNGVEIDCPNPGEDLCIDDILEILRDPLEPGKCVQGDCDCGLDCVDKASGNLVVMHEIATDFDVDLTLVYNRINANPQRTVSVNATIPLRFALPDKVSSRVRIAGVWQRAPIFTLTSGLDENSDETFYQTLPIFATDLPLGYYPYTVELTSHYPASAVSSSIDGRVLINNQKNSPFGAGWSLKQWHRLYPQSDGSLLFAEGIGNLLRFVPFGIVMLQDDFDQENNGAQALNYDAFANFNVADGFVDVVPNPFGNGIVIDLDGNRRNGGRLESKTNFTLTPGVYQLEFDLAGNPASNTTETVHVEWADVFGRSLVLNRTDPFRRFQFSIQVNVPTSGKIVFDTDSKDNVGALLDNVLLVQSDPSIFRSPQGDNSSLVNNPDGSYTRTLANGTKQDFDASGIHTSTRHPNGRSTHFSSDENGHLLEVRDEHGSVISFFNNQGVLETITGPPGQATRLTHDADGNLIQIQDPDNTVRDFTYDDHRLTSQRSKGGVKSEYVPAFLEEVEAYFDEYFSAHYTRWDGWKFSLSPEARGALPDLAAGEGSAANPGPVVRAADVQAQVTQGGPDPNAPQPPQVKVQLVQNGQTIDPTTLSGDQVLGLVFNFLVDDPDDPNLEVLVSGSVVDDNEDLQEVAINRQPVTFTQAADPTQYNFDVLVPKPATNRFGFAVTALDLAGLASEQSVQVEVDQGTPPLADTPKLISFQPEDGATITFYEGLTRTVEFSGTIEDLDANLASITVNDVSTVSTNVALSQSAEGIFFKGSVNIPDGNSVRLQLEAFDAHGRPVSLDGPLGGRDLQERNIRVLTKPLNLETISWGPDDDREIQVADATQPHEITVTGSILDPSGNLTALSVNGSPLFFQHADNSFAAHFSGTVTVPEGGPLNLVLSAENADGEVLSETHSVNIVESTTPNRAPEFIDIIAGHLNTFVVPQGSASFELPISVFLEDPDANLAFVRVEKILIHLSSPISPTQYTAHGILTIAIPPELRDIGGDLLIEIAAEDEAGASIVRSVPIKIEVE